MSKEAESSHFEIVSDPAGLNRALFEVTHGLYILTAVRDGWANGQCLDAMMQVTNTPPRVAIGVGKKSLTHEMITATGRFAVNVLNRDDPNCPAVIRRFGFQSGRDVDKFADFPYDTGTDGLPLLPQAKAFYECRVLPEFTLDLGTHTLFVAAVERAGVRESGEPLTYNEYRKTMRKRR